MAVEADLEWWKTGVIYQVYPRSFMDSDGDGVGDLAGIESRLDHFVDLGVDGVWISPIYPSPMVDFGYDVTDHCDVDPVFGTLADIDSLLDAAHARRLKLILDYVPNHTSDRHPWFRDSRQSLTSEKRDWYIWRDPAPDGGPPNNWLSEFGGPAWTFDAPTGQYYYHAYLSAQPDLNWRNPEVVRAMLDVLHFWFGRGVDGFRVDAVAQLIKDDRFRDNPANPRWNDGLPPSARLLRIHQKDQPELQDYAAAMRRVADSYGGRLLAAEAYLPIDRLMTYYGEGLGGFHMPYNFHLISTSWEPRAVAALVEAYEAALPDGAWPNWVLGNHDRSRVASRLGAPQARVAAMLHLTLRGTPTIYQGEELGMENVPIPPELVQDPWEKNEPGRGLGRDPVRTPIAWERAPGAGFTTGEPWLPIDTRPGMCVEVQAGDDASMLTLYRRLLSLRRHEPALTIGSYRTLGADDALYSYERRHGNRSIAVVLNFSGERRPLPVVGGTLLTTRSGASGIDGSMLAANEGRVIALA